MSKVNFSLLLNVYRSLTFDQGTKRGTLTISSPSLRDTLKLLLEEENLDDSGITLLPTGSLRLEIGEVVHLQVEQPRLALGVLAGDLDVLLRSIKAHVEERKNYFLIDSKYAPGDQAVPFEIQRYKSLLGFVQLLKEGAAYLEIEREELIFIHNGKFSLPVIYCKADILSIDESAMEAIKMAFSNDIHREQKLAILADAAINLVKGVPSAERFQRLLAHLPELQKKFSDGYNLFASSFSYDKIRDEVETAKVEYTGKIHKVFSDIQNQVLGIPIASIVVATQMKDAGAKTATTYEVYVNSAVLLGCWIFVLLTGLLIWNQQHTLKVLEGEINRQKELMHKKHHVVAPIFDDVFFVLNKRLSTQYFVLWTIAAILISGLILAHVVYFSLTPIAFSWLKSFF